MDGKERRAVMFSLNGVLERLPASVEPARSKDITVRQEFACFFHQTKCEGLVVLWAYFEQIDRSYC